MWSLWACETITASSSRGSNANWRLGLLGSIRSESNNPQSSKIRLEPISSKMGAARDLTGRAVERDSQPSSLPTIDRAPALRQRHGLRMLGNAIGHASRPIVPELDRSHPRRQAAGSRHGPYFRLSPDC